MAPQAFITGMPVVGCKTSFTSPAVCKRQPHRHSSSDGRAQWTMGKVAKFGPFTPAIVATKHVIGEKKLNKVRGKAIALHTQAITSFCDFTHAGPKTRQSLIRAAKNNGNTLGFLS